MVVFLFLSAIVLYVIYKWSISTFDYFEKQGIPFRKPVPLLGTQGNFVTRKKAFVDAIQETYYEYRNEK